LRYGAAVNLAQNTAYQEAAALEARFRMAARHSRLVRLLRIAVPAAVLFAMAVIVGASVFNPFRMLKLPAALDTGNLLVSGTKITMETLHLAGFTPDQRPYELWSTTAVQDLTDPDHVELNKLKTRVVMEDGSTAWLDARTGKFDNKQQTLDLHKDIVMKTTSGYEARLSQAFVDMGKNTVTSEEHVDVKMSNGTVSSDRLRIYGGGEVVRFEGNVVMNLDHLDTGDGSAQQADATPAAAEPAAPKTTRSTKSFSASGAK
jgi:lipopolysaccharide export system protein LptC